MATIVRRETKSGVTYRIQVRFKDRGSGKVTFPSTTWKPAPGMTRKQMERAVIIFADEYEKQLQDAEKSANGEMYMSPDSTVKEYVNWWLDRRKDEISLSYFVNCQTAADEIIGHIGAYKLRELNPAIIQRFYDEIDRRERTKVTVTGHGDVIRRRMKELEKKKYRMCSEGGICKNTLDVALNSGTITEECAKKIANELGMNVNALFDIKREKLKFAFESNQKIKRTFRTILASAKKQRIITDNYASADYINFPRRPKKEIDYMNDEDAKKFYAAAEASADIRMRTVAELLLLTGIRRGEICGLEWDDVDFDAETITIRRSVVTVKGHGPVTKEPKTESSNREIGISGHLLQLLRDYKEWYDAHCAALGDKWIPSNRLFIAEYGEPINPSTIRFWVDKICDAAGLPHRTVHSLRHTNITMQIAAGVPLVTVSGRAGHARTSTTTDFYSHFLKSSDKTAARVIESIFEQSEPEHATG